MKIVSYNVSNCTQEKLDKIFSQNADLYVIPECSCSRDIKIPENYEMLWDGIEYQYRNANLSKGLGMIVRKGLSKTLDCCDSDLKYAIPLMVGDLLVIGFWPTKINENKNKTYLQIAEEILKYYAPHFTEKTIIVGDFNLYHKEGAKNFDVNLLPVNELLESYGFKSLYHKTKNESLGHEFRATYYHQYKEDQPFFLDYAYSNFPVKGYDLFDLGRDMSDHVGQVVCF